MIPQDWTESQLSDLVSDEAPICYGILMPGDGVTDGVPVLKVKDMTTAGINTANLLRTTRAIDEQYKRSRLKNGDIVLSIRGTTGRVAITPPELENGNITQDTARLRINGKADRDFIYHSLLSPKVQSQIQLHTVGQAVKGINLGEVKKLKIACPPLPEQKRIAGILSEWVRAIDLANRKLESLHKLRRSLSQLFFSEEFNANFDVSDLKELAKIRRGASPRPINNPDFFADAGRAWVRIADVTNQRKYLRYASQYLSKLGESKSVSVDRGQLIMSICATIGVPMIVDIPSCIHDGFVLITGYESRVSTDYLYYLLSSMTKKLATGGQPGTQRNLNTTIVGAISVPVPPFEVQEKIVQALSTLDSVLDRQEHYIEALTRQRHGLMQQLLTGKVRVKV